MDPEPPVAGPELPQPQPQHSAEQEAYWGQLRAEVARAIRSVAAEHAYKAYTSLSSPQRLSPHAVSLFYAKHDPSQYGGLKIYTVSRWSFDDDLNRDLPKFLEELVSVAAKFAASAPRGHRWDPRGPDKPLINWGDKDMPQDVTAFAGLGVATLDTAKGDWFDWVLPAHEANPFKPMFGADLPGEAVVIVGDNSVIRFNRDRQLDLGYDGVSCTHSMDPSRPGLRASHLLQYLGPRLTQAWPNIVKLNNVLLNQYKV